MDKPSFNPDNFFKKACVFESALILVAVVLGWIANINPFENLYFSELAIVYGVIGTMPLFLLFLVMRQMQSESVVKIKELLFEALGPNFHRYHWTDLLVLAAIAGLSEELLFRGVIQPWMESSWGMTTGLIGSNVIFGLPPCCDTALRGAGGFSGGLFKRVSGLWRRQKFIAANSYPRFVRFFGVCRINAYLSGKPCCLNG